ncbi:uncharacterized protein [Rutidosis leptorrhynchoides]|uniref:uncharacterized protein isoform X2 n=1 Tax=Rutidosis leptorrhynchoides TaxID=125765 RepID=UPI003A9A0493
MQDLDHIQVDERARNLKRFEIKGNYHLKSICLSNLDLVAFTCKGFHIDLDLAHLSKLKELELDISFLSFNDVFNQISACALSLQYLSISVDEPEDFSLLEYVPKLPNLKKLRLAVGGNGDDCLLFLASVLNACPNLETFSITPRWISPIIRRKKARDATNPHKHLKLVEIEEYKGYCMKKEAVLSRAKLIESIMPKGVDLVIV